MANGTNDLGIRSIYTGEDTIGLKMDRPSGSGMFDTLNPEGLIGTFATGQMTAPGPIGFMWSAVATIAGGLLQGLTTSHDQPEISEYDKWLRRMTKHYYNLGKSYSIYRNVGAALTGNDPSVFENDFPKSTAKIIAKKPYPEPRPSMTSSVKQVKPSSKPIEQPEPIKPPETKISITTPAASAVTGGV